MVLIQPPHTSSKLQGKVIVHCIYWDKSVWEEYNTDKSVILGLRKTKISIIIQTGGNLKINEKL